MKRLVILLAFLAASCSPFGLSSSYSVHYEPLDTAWPKATAITYVSDAAPYWQSPRETMERGAGDCEDIATYLVYLLGPDASLALIRSGSVTSCAVLYRGRYLHYSVVGAYYGACVNGVLDGGGCYYNVIEILDYWTTMHESTDGGTRNLAISEARDAEKS